MRKGFNLLKEFQVFVREETEVNIKKSENNKKLIYHDYEKKKWREVGKEDSFFGIKKMYKLKFQVTFLSHSESSSFYTHFSHRLNVAWMIIMKRRK
jgi:hypothetical protein